MNMKKSFKRFWTMQKHTGGFTLVELIVVIAILAILAGIGIPAYSGYITKANKQADITLASEVANALQLYHYSHAMENVSGYVAITPEGEVCGFDEGGKAAMDAVFGAGWENELYAKYDGWKNNGTGDSLTGSSFDGKEKELMNKVNDLSNTLENFLKEYQGDAEGFFPYLQKLGIDKDADPNAAANAAVLYVGEAVKNADQAAITNILSSVPSKIVDSMNASGSYKASQIMLETAGNLQAEFGGSTMAAAAVMYAYAESYAMATGQTLTINASNIKDGKTGLDEVQRAFTELMDIEKTVQTGKLDAMKAWGGITGDPENPGKYLLGENAAYKKDANAVVSTMKAVNNVSNVLKDNLTKEELFADSAMQDIVTQYLNASAAVKDGAIGVWLYNGETYPLSSCE